MSQAARRWFSGAQCAVGLSLLLRPESVVTALIPEGSAVPDPRIVRVLGARQATQGVVGLVRPTQSVLAAGALVDALHALSLVPIIAVSNRYRASAAVSAGLATTAAAGGRYLTRR